MVSSGRFDWIGFGTLGATTATFVAAERLGWFVNAPGRFVMAATTFVFRGTTLGGYSRFTIGYQRISNKNEIARTMIALRSMDYRFAGVAPRLRRGFAQTRARPRPSSSISHRV